MNVRVSKRCMYVCGAILLIAIIILAWPAIISAADGAAPGVQSAKAQAAEKARNAGTLGVLNKIQEPQVAALFSRDSAVATEASGARRLGQMGNGHTDRQAVRLVSDSPSAKQRAAELAGNASPLGVIKKGQHPDLAAIFSGECAVGSNVVAGEPVTVPDKTKR